MKKANKKPHVAATTAVLNESFGHLIQRYYTINLAIQAQQLWEGAL